jgi:hypothetical protein
MYNKAEILKKYNLSEEEFYKKFPTPEDYHKYENGGQLGFKKKYITGGGITPISFKMPSSLTTPIKTFTPGVNAPAPTSESGFKLPNISGLTGGGQQQAPQQAGSDPNTPVKKNTFKTTGNFIGAGLGIGATIATGGAALPLIPTLTGIGGEIGGFADKKVFENKMEDYSANKSSQQNAMASNIPGNFNPNAPTKQFKNGGSLKKQQKAFNKSEQMYNDSLALFNSANLDNQWMSNIDKNNVSRQDFNTQMQTQDRDALQDAYDRLLRTNNQAPEISSDTLNVLRSNSPRATKELILMNNYKQPTNPPLNPNNFPTQKERDAQDLQDMNLYQRFENGGPLSGLTENNKSINLKGLTHDQGGITLANGKDEVQNKEVIVKYKDENGQKQSFVLSHDIMYNKRQSLADKSRADAKKYFRDNDPIDAKARELGNKKYIELNLLALNNMKLNNNNMNYNNSMMYGGILKNKYRWGGTGLKKNKFNLSRSEDRATSMLSNDLKFDTNFNAKPNFQNDNLDVLPGSDLNINNKVFEPTMAATGDTKSRTIPNLIENNNFKNYSSSPSKKINFDNLASYGNLAGQLVGDSYNVLQGLKGGDPVNFDRMNTKYQFTDPRGAMTAANRGITSAYNSAKNAVRNTTTSAGEYLANMGNLSSKEGMDRATAMANIKGQYDAGNIQGLNQTNLTKDQYNAQVQMKESDARQQEQDAARSAISRGLSDIGSKIGSFNNEKSSRNNQNNLINLMSSNGYKLITGKNGELSFEKDGKFVPYQVAIASVLQPQTPTKE